MNRVSTLLAFALPAVALGACESQPRSNMPTESNTEYAVEANTVGTTDSNAPPPMIVRSPAYRCDDGAALYVDVLTDENSVMVRDSRTDIPVTLSRDAPSEGFEGSDRTLSGTGTEVSYATPDRPQQACREAQE